MKISRRNFLKTTLATSMAFSAAGCAQDIITNGEQSKKKNILFIIFDDLNDSVEGFGGHPQAKTPNIDRLAKRGTKFLNAATNAPICGPSRPSMLTGLYPHTTGCYGPLFLKSPGRENISSIWDAPEFKDTKTWVQYFKEHGYETGVTGKVYHNGTERPGDLINDEGKRVFGPKVSFGPFPYPESEGTRHPSVPYASNPISAFGRLSDVPTNGWSLYNKPFKYESQTDRDKMPDELVVEWAEDFLKQHEASKSRKPFFLNVGIIRPHEPFIAPDKYFDMFPLDDVQLAPGIKEGDLDDCAPFQHKDFTTGKRLWQRYGYSRYNSVAQHGDLKRITQAYLACVAFADDMVGRVLNALENSPYKDDTLIVLTSDHAYHIGEKEYIHKETPWERSARIPLIIAGDGIKEGCTVDNPVSLVDIYPTLIDYAGLPSQPHSSTKLDGNSLMPFVGKSNKTTWQGSDFTLTAVTTRHIFRNKPFPGCELAESKMFTVRTKEYRYIICPDGGEELYDMIKDPYEWDNIASDPNYKEIKNRLKAKAENLIGKKLGAFYHPNSYTPRDYKTKEL